MNSRILFELSLLSIVVLQVYVDKQFQREVDGIQVFCCNKVRGCTWSSSLRDLVVSQLSYLIDIVLMRRLFWQYIVCVG